MCEFLPFSTEPDTATREMLRVLKPGGRIAFATWTPTVLIVAALSGDAARLAEWRAEHDRIVGECFAEGRVRLEYLLTRATKA
jgi:ubiquinone/menaquinone biosynthesis C-methylase UbiE